MNGLLPWETWSISTVIALNVRASDGTGWGYPNQDSHDPKNDVVQESDGDGDLDVVSTSDHDTTAHTISVVWWENRIIIVKEIRSHDRER